MFCCLLACFLVYSKLGLPMTPRKESGEVMDSDKCSTLDVFDSVGHVTVM